MDILKTVFAESQIPNKEDVINQLFPNLWIFVSHVIAFSLLLTLLIFLAWKPTKRYIQKRRMEIQKKYQDAQTAQMEADKNLELSQNKILDTKLVAANILETAQIEAEEKRKRIETEAVNKANYIEKERRSQMDKEEAEMKTKINLEASKLALETVELFLSKKIDEKKDIELVDQIVKDLTQKLEQEQK